MSERRGSLGLTGATLLSNHCITLVELYLQLGDWNLVRRKAVAENVLQYERVSASKRVCSDLVGRLRTLNDSEIAYFIQAIYEERLCLIWLAACRCHWLLAEFFVDVVSRRYESMEPDLRLCDFDTFFDAKQQVYPQLARTSKSTRNNVRKNIYVMLRQAGFLDEQHRLRRVRISGVLLQLLRKTGPEWLLCLPYACLDAVN